MSEEQTPPLKVALTEGLGDTALGRVMAAIVKHADHDLFSKSREELEQYWFFKWEPGHSLEWNTYIFFQRLEGYRRSCRQWEEHHFGSVCVVERVRDEYLMPKIRAFLASASLVAPNVKLCGERSESERT